VFLLKTPHATVKKSSLCPRFTCPRRLRTASPMSFLAVTPLTHCWCLPGTTLSGCTIPLTTFKCMSTPTRLPCSTRASGRSDSQCFSGSVDRSVRVCDLSTGVDAHVGSHDNSVKAVAYLRGSGVLVTGRYICIRHEVFSHLLIRVLQLGL